MLRLLPDPNVPAFTAEQFGLLPCGGDQNEHYAVVFLSSTKVTDDRMFDVNIFSSQTQRWSRKVPLLALSESDKVLLPFHETCKQITIGSSVGWVDLLRGILLLRNLSDKYPVIEYIPFPAPRPCISYEEDCDAPEYFRDVACCSNLIKFVDIEFHDPEHSRAKGWKATTWNRKLSWGDWRRRFTVEVSDISVDQSYSALLPELWDDKTKKLDLKNLIFCTPTLSMCDDDCLYVMSKVKNEDDKAWVITVDMKRAAVQAVAPFSAEQCNLLPMCCPCAFPKYLNMTPGADMTNPLHKYFKRMGAEKCAVEVLWTQDWLRELDQCLELQRSIYIDCRSLHCCPVSSLRFNIRAVVEYASCIGRGKAASKAVDLCLRALEDFDLLLCKALSDPSTSTEAMRSKISTALGALNNVLQFARPTMMAGGTTLVHACHQKREKTIFEHCERPGHKNEYIQLGLSDGKLFCNHCKKPGHEKDKCDNEQQVGLDGDYSCGKQQNQAQHWKAGSLGRRLSLSFWGLNICCILLVALSCLHISFNVLNQYLHPYP